MSQGSPRRRGIGPENVRKRPEVIPVEPPPKVSGKVSGAGLKTFSKGKLGGGESYIAYGGNSGYSASKNTARPAYDVDVSDEEITIRGKKGSQTIKAPGLKGKASGKITTDTLELMQLSDDGDYEVDLDGDRLRFKREVDGRVRDRFSIKLMPHEDSANNAAEAKNNHGRRMSHESRLRAIQAEEERQQRKAEQQAVLERARAEREQRFNDRVDDAKERQQKEAEFQAAKARELERANPFRRSA